jgi:hypothetical protein
LAEVATGVFFAVLLGELVLATAYSIRRRAAPARVDGVQQLVVPACLLAALGCLALIPVAIGFSDLDPAECAPMTPGEANALVAAMTALVAAAAALSTWAAVRASRGEGIQGQLILKLAALAGAVVLVLALAGGTSC